MMVPIATVSLAMPRTNGGNGPADAMDGWSRATRHGGEKGGKSAGDRWEGAWSVSASGSSSVLHCASARWARLVRRACSTAAVDGTRVRGARKQEARCGFHGSEMMGPL